MFHDDHSDVFWEARSDDGRDETEDETFQQLVRDGGSSQRYEGAISLWPHWESWLEFGGSSRFMIFIQVSEMLFFSKMVGIARWCKIMVS